jgi:3-dehydroquinate dehydratase-2
MINNIHIVNGPNLNLLGTRQKKLYGSVSFEDYFATLIHHFPEITLSYFQSNHEGHLIDYLHAHGFEDNTGIILNAGGLTHTSVVLRDAVSSIEAPVLEVHITDIYKREPFRWHSYLTPVCVNHFIGHGLEGYRMGVEFFLKG